MKDYFDWDVLNREFSQEERERLAEKGHALPDGSYPIVTREDLENAIQAIGRAKDPGAAKAHIKKRARALGLEELIPEEWNSVDRPPLKMSRPVAKLRQGRTDWYRIDNKANAAPEVFIYDEIGYFGVTASDFAADIRALDTDELTLHINSPGGDVYDGLAIYQALRTHRASVTVHVDGLAASAASFIAMAADKVVMAPRSSLMIHDAYTMTIGNAGDIRKTADLLDKASQNIAEIYAEKAGTPVDFWRDRMRDETWYDAQEAVDAGLADEVEGKAKKIDNSFDLSIFNYSGRDKAPAPVIEPVAKVIEPEPVIEPIKPEEPEFSWDFAGFTQALKEGIRD